MGEAKLDSWKPKQPMPTQNRSHRSLADLRQFRGLGQRCGEYALGIGKQDVSDFALRLRRS